jgi:hypothetical protein
MGMRKDLASLAYLGVSWIYGKYLPWVEYSASIARSTAKLGFVLRSAANAGVGAAAALSDAA